MKLLKWIGIIVGGMVIIFLLLMLQPWVFLPHHHIEISLPFAPADDDAYLIPMGEKIVHNTANGNPDGHPGIDFGWDRRVAIIASADGRITKLSKFNNEGYEVDQSSGFYGINYKEIGLVAPGLHIGSRVKKGDLIGYTGTNPSTPKDSPNHQQIHWEFISSSKFIDRLCPINYFDAASKTRVEKIWANIPAGDQFKKSYPEICNGVFAGKED